MATSAVPRAKAAMLSTITTALAASTDVLVSYGIPFTNRPAEIVAVCGVRSTQTPVTLGNRSRDEDIEIDVVCSVQYGGTDQQTVTERAFVILGLVETALRNDPTLGAVVMWAEPGDITLTETDEDSAASGRFADVLCRVAVRARL